MAESKTYGLRLTLGGAPDTPHIIGTVPAVRNDKGEVVQPGAEVPGHYRPSTPTPVGGPGELSLDVARDLDKDERIPLELVEIPKSKVSSAREQSEQDRAEARAGVLDAAADNVAAERQRASNETAALAAPNGGQE